MHPCVRSITSSKRVHYVSYGGISLLHFTCKCTQSHFGLLKRIPSPRYPSYNITTSRILGQAKSWGLCITITELIIWGENEKEKRGQPLYVLPVSTILCSASPTDRISASRRDITSSAIVCHSISKKMRLCVDWCTAYILLQFDCEPWSVWSEWSV